MDFLQKCQLRIRRGSCVELGVNGYSVFFGFLAICSFIGAAWNIRSGDLPAGEVLLIPCVANVIGAVVIGVVSRNPPHHRSGAGLFDE